MPCMRFSRSWSLLATTPRRRAWPRAPRTRSSRSEEKRQPEPGHLHRLFPCIAQPQPPAQQHGAGGGADVDDAGRILVARHDRSAASLAPLARGARLGLAFALLLLERIVGGDDLLH